MTQRNITLTLTDAGRAALINAANAAANVQFTAIALGSGTVALGAGAEALTNQREQANIFSSSSPAPGQLSLSALFNVDPAAAYDATEMALIGDGVVFGVWSVTDPTQALVVRTPGVPYTATIAVGYAQLPSQNVTVLIQPLDVSLQAISTDIQNNSVNSVFQQLAPVTDTGAVNAYVAANVVPLTAQTLVQGTRQRVLIKTTNTGPSTYAPDDLPPAPILGTRLLPFRGGEVRSGLIFDFEYIVNANINGGNGAWLMKGGADFGSMGIPIVSISALPTSNIGPVMVAEMCEIWTWSNSSYYSGYRSLDCGNPVFGASAAASIRHLDAVGGSVSKAAYPGLWGWAQEQSLVVTSANWAAGTHNFVDNGDGTFKLPDLRNQFFRATGTNADTANARTNGSGQIGSIASHQHTFAISGSVINPGSGSGGFLVVSTGANAYVSNVGGSETRPTNVAYAPRLHI